MNFHQLFSLLIFGKMRNAEINISKLKNKNCPTCGENPTFPHLAFENQTKADVLCGRDAIQIRPATSMSFSLDQLAESLTGVVSNVMVNPYLLSCILKTIEWCYLKMGVPLSMEHMKSSRARAIYNKVIQCYKS